MKLVVFSSSSSGNAYFLDNGREALLLECGLPMKKITSYLGFAIARCVGCLVSHEHIDHARSAQELSTKRLLPMYLSQGTGQALWGEKKPMRATYLEAMKEVRIGKFLVTPIPVQHDAAEPFGYLIKHEEIGSLLFATDTSYLKYKFAGLNHLMIECNYDADILEENVLSGLIHHNLKERTIRNHMSLTTCREVVQANDSAKLRNVILLHLSRNNADEQKMRLNIDILTRAAVHVAKPGLVIDLKETPF